VYLDHIPISIVKLKPKIPKILRRSNVSFGCDQMSTIAPIESASPNIRSENVSILDLILLLNLSCNIMSARKKLLKYLVYEELK